VNEISVLVETESFPWTSANISLLSWATWIYLFISFSIYSVYNLTYSMALAVDLRSLLGSLTGGKAG